MLTLGWIVGSSAQAKLFDHKVRASGEYVVYCDSQCGELNIPGFTQVETFRRFGFFERIGLAQPQLGTSPSENLFTAQPLGADFVFPDNIEAGEAVRVKWRTSNGVSGPMATVGTALAKIGDWVEDLDTGSLYTSAEFAANAAAYSAPYPEVTRMVSVQNETTSKQQTQLVTIGMEKAGLPNLILRFDDPEQTTQMEALLLLVAQESKDQQSQGGQFATRSFDLEHCTGTGHVSTAFAALATSAVQGPVRQVWVHEWESTSCEPPNDWASNEVQPKRQTNHTVKFETADDLATVQARALQKLRTDIKNRFDDPNDDMRLLVKAPFSNETQDVEWLWIEVDRWTDEQVLSGSLQSQPAHIQNMQPGQSVATPLDLIFDYMWSDASGAQGGNTTQAFL